MESSAQLAEASRIQATFGSPERQNRWTIVFRFILLLPHLFVLAFRGIVVEIVVFIGWFVALVTGRLPTRIGSYAARYIQYNTRVYAYYWLMLDRYPPFSLGDQDYPVSVQAHPVKLRRLAVLFRFILLIPAEIVAGLLTTGIAVSGLFIWLIVLISGRMPRSLYEAVGASLRFIARYMGYVFMVSTAYPGELLGDASAKWQQPEQTPADSPLRSTIDRPSLGIPAGPSTSRPPPMPGLPRWWSIANDPNDEAYWDGKAWMARRRRDSPGASWMSVPIRDSDEDAASHRPVFASGWPIAAPVASSEATAPTLHRDDYLGGLVISKAAKRIVVLFVVLGLLGVAGDVTVEVVFVRNAIESTAQAVETAQTIGLQVADFPAGTSVNADDAQSLIVPSPVSTCTPVSSKPWLADVFSSGFGLDVGTSVPFNHNASSDVVIMRDSSDANSALASIGARNYANLCFRSAYDRSVVGNYTASAACGSLYLAGSRIGPLSTFSNRDGFVAYRDVAILRCRSNGAASAVYQDTVSTVVGHAFIQGVFTGVVTPDSTAQEQHVMSAMVSRAQLLFGFPATST